MYREKSLVGVLRKRQFSRNLGLVVINWPSGIRGWCKCGRDQTEIKGEEEKKGGGGGGGWDGWQKLSIKRAERPWCEYCISMFTAITGLFAGSPPTEGKNGKRATLLWDDENTACPVGDMRSGHEHAHTHTNTQTHLHILLEFTATAVTSPVPRWLNWS